MLSLHNNFNNLYYLNRRISPNYLYWYILQPGLDDRILSQLLEDNMPFANGPSNGVKSETKKVEKSDWSVDCVYVFDYLEHF